MPVDVAFAECFTSGSDDVWPCRTLCVNVAFVESFASGSDDVWPC